MRFKVLLFTALLSLQLMEGANGAAGPPIPSSSPHQQAKVKSEATFIGYIDNNKQWIFSGIGVSALAIIWKFIISWVRGKQAAGAHHDKAESGDSHELRQDGILIIPLRTGVHDFHYPKTFRAPPLLQVKCVEGRIGLSIVEQRRDGFRLQTYGGGYGSPDVKVRFEAIGERS